MSAIKSLEPLAALPLTQEPGNHFFGFHDLCPFDEGDARGVVVRTDFLDRPPDGNHFPTDGDLHSLLSSAGLALLGAADARRMSAQPSDWRDRAEAVECELHERFGRTAQLRTSDEQGERIGQLLQSGQLSCRVLVLHGN